MQEKPKSWPGSFTILYILAALLVAATSVLAILANAFPAKAALLTWGLDMQIAVFMVPVAALMFALLAEVLRATLSGIGTGRPPAPALHPGEWKPGHNEG
jgi:hypothetical protein